MVKLVLCLVLFVVGAIGKELLTDEDSFINESLEVKADIPLEVWEEDNAEIIPTNGNNLLIGGIVAFVHLQ